MQNPFEIKGYWWIPGGESNKIPGTLTYSQEEGAALELLGVFNLKENRDSEAHQLILGTAQNGKLFTLFKCLQCSYTYPFGGLGGSEYIVHLIFEGVHFEKKEEIKFFQLSGKYSDLDAWINNSGFTFDWGDFKEPFEVKIEYKQPQSKFFEIDKDFEAGISFSFSGPSLYRVQTEASINQSASIVVRSQNNEIQFEELFSKLNTFSYLVNIAVQRPLFPLSIQGLSKENYQELSNGKYFYPEINIYYQPIEPIIKQKPKIPEELLFTYNDLSANQISEWFEKFTKFETIIHLYRSVFSNNRIYIDTKYLNIVQSLESLHSTLLNGKYYPQGEFKERKKRVLDVIPKDLSKWVEDALSNANYKRLKQKIFELADNKKETFGRIVDDFDLFAKKVTDTRNEFVHHDKKNSIFQKEELPSVIYQLTILFELYLLEIIGFPEEKAVELLEPKIQTHLTKWKHLRKIKNKFNSHS